MVRYDWPPPPFVVALLFVIVNHGLTQIIAAVRLLHELTCDCHRRPVPFARVNERTDTPLIATAASGAVGPGLALFVPLATLAQGTSMVILIGFNDVKAAL